MNRLHMRVLRPATRAACALGVAACLMTAGCASVRRAREVQDQTRPPAGERTVTAAEVGLGSNSVLSLDGAVRIALAYHPSVVQARRGFEAAEAQLRQAQAARQPTLNANAGYKRGTSNTGAAPADNSLGSSYSGSLNLSLLLYDFGKTPAVVRQALLAETAAAESLRAARNDAAYGVRTAFLDLLRAQELLQVSDEAVRQYRDHLNQVKSFAEVGRRTRYDITKSEVDLGNAQLDLINARNGLATARAVLNRGLGLAEDPRYRPGPGEMEDVGGGVDGLMATARERHPEIRALRAQEFAASAAVDAAIADLYPSLSLGGQYALGGSGFPLVWNWSGALQAGVELLSGGNKNATIDQAVAQLRSARARIADREQQIYLDLTKAWNQMDGARQRLALTDLTVRQAQESLELVRERYRLGQSSAVDVTDAEVTLTRARADRVNARFDYQTAVAQIKHAIGEE